MTPIRPAQAEAKFLIHKKYSKWRPERFFQTLSSMRGIKTVLFFLFLLSVCFVIRCLVCELNAEQKAIIQPPQIRLVFGGLIEGQEIIKHDLGIIKFELVIEQDKGPDGRPYRSEAKFEENILRITVNGKDIPYYISGHGQRHDAKASYSLRDISIRPGPEAGEKAIQVKWGSLSARVTFSFRPAGQIELCQVFEGKALFGKEQNCLDWLGCYLKRNTIKLMINGKEVSSEIKASKYGEELLEGLIKGQLNLGANQIKIEAMDTNSEKLEKHLTVFYYPNNEIPAGDNFSLYLAPMGSNSGPFYRVVLEGKSLNVLTKGSHQSELLQNDITTGLGKQGFAVERERPVITPFKATKQGKSIIIIEKKKHFKDKVWLEDKRIPVSVMGM